jgi:hypothetical protein
VLLQAQPACVDHQAGVFLHPTQVIHSQPVEPGFLALILPLQAR